MIFDPSRTHNLIIFDPQFPNIIPVAYTALNLPLPSIGSLVESSGSVATGPHYFKWGGGTNNTIFITSLDGTI
jgi:hypothetical protein